MFEVGVVYKRLSGPAGLWLAVTPETLVSLKRGVLAEVTPYKRASFVVVRSITVAELCQRWGVESADLDRELARWLAPSPEGLKPAPRGSRTQRLMEAVGWRELRTHCLAHARAAI